jgi:Protein of unknown function (DUF2934)
MTDHEERIRMHAYRIWEEEGRPEGRAEVHWNMARDLVAVEGDFDNSIRPAPPLGADAQSGEPTEEAFGSEIGELPTMTDREERAYPASRETATRKTPRRSA